MGRPLNKKYFGNRNVGTTGTTDNKIGGEGISGITWSTTGSFRGNDGAHNPLVGFALPAPSIPGGVQAAWNPLFEVATVTTGAGSVDLEVGDTYTYAGLGSPVFTVATSTDNSTNATFTVTSRGSFDLTAMPGDTTGVNITKLTGNGVGTFQVDISFRVKSITITEKGSGYTGAETFTVTGYPGSAGTFPAGTIALTTDSGVVGSATNQENAIIIHANTGNEGAQIGDIIRQVSTRRYKVKADGTAVCELVNDDTPAYKKAYIKATDDNGNTYFVMKLTSKLAVLKQWTNNESTWLFEDNARAHWTFSSSDDSYDAADSVVIENA